MFLAFGEIMPIFEKDAQKPIRSTRELEHPLKKPTLLLYWENSVFIQATTSVQTKVFSCMTETNNIF